MAKKKKIVNNIDQIATQDFVNYAMYVDTDRAIPDVRDNLKPVHRRILYAMWKGSYIASKPYVKSARAVGDVIGLYHPHGDTSIYDAKVRLAQPWKMRYPLIDMHGNKGSIDGDSAAAMRYTETRLSQVGMMMVDELSQKPVEMKPNYDNSTLEPAFMPSMFPNIIANGSMGIGVGMSSSILPHNITDTINTINAYIKNSDITDKQILKYIKGPDFPTGGVIVNHDNLLDVYTNGKGTVRVRAKYELTKIKGCDIITFTELPYLKSLDKIKAKIIALYNEGEFEELETILRDDTSNLSVDFQLKLKKGANVHKALKILFEKCGLESSIQMNNMVIQNGIPTRLPFKQLIKEYVDHRHFIITRIAENQLVSAEERLHIVDGLMIAMQDIDGVIKIIKESASRAVASQALQGAYKLTEIQAVAILDMKLGRLTSLETTKLVDEKSILEATIKRLKDLIATPSSREKIILEQLEVMKKTLGDKRRTALDTVDEMDEIIEEDIVVLLHDHNEITIMSASDIAESSKGTKGKNISSSTINGMLNCKTTDKICFITKEAKLYYIEAFMLEQNKQFYLNSILTTIEGEIVKMIVFTPEDFLAGNYLVTASKNGILKKTAIASYKNLKQGTQLAKLKTSDELLSVGVGNDDFNVIIVADKKLLKISFKDLKDAGRATIGVKGTNNKTIDSVAFSHELSRVLSYSKGGKGKLSPTAQFNKTTRATGGYKTDILEVYSIAGRQPVIIIGEDNKAIKIDSNSISVKGPDAQGSKIYNGEIKMVSLSYQKF